MEPCEIRTERHAVTAAVRATLPRATRIRRRWDAKHVEARLGRAIPAFAAASRPPWRDQTTVSACTRHRHSDSALTRGVDTHRPRRSRVAHPASTPVAAKLENADTVGARNRRRGRMAAGLLAALVLASANAGTVQAEGVALTNSDGGANGSLVAETVTNMSHTEDPGSPEAEPDTPGDETAPPGGGSGRPGGGSGDGQS